uniref:Ricin B lectin domain-containing protein n=1 Tax=Noctiluca scintillans TaxID=2966 RepID=A0A7S1AY00_NOCSC
MEQQVWGYDSTGGSIYLAQSQSDASLCMDLAGGSFDLGTVVQIWSCNGLGNQQWGLSSGISMRLGVDFKKCFDLAGGNTANGATIQVWDCNGLWNQKWVFEDWQIKPAYDTSKCIDAGGLTPGNPLMIWDCNGYAQQIFGYDYNMQTMYLAQSSSDASLCVDLSGGSSNDGTAIEIWSCTGCWNQQFIVVGPSASLATNLTMSLGTPRYVADDCPPSPSPGPTPTPGPPSPYVYGRCVSGGATYNYPVFSTQADLEADAAWSKYFKVVYGQVPSSGYPICVYYGIYIMYMTTASQSGISMPTTASKSCPTKDGEFFAIMSGLTGKNGMNANWIYSSDLMRGQSSYSIESNKWVEVTHTAFSMDGAATWLYYTPGSGFWLWTGQTKAYDDHQDAVKDLLGETCVSKRNECGSYFSDLYKATITAGLTTISFVKHNDMQCGSGDGNLAIEIVDNEGSGTKTCGGDDGLVRFKAGWMASADCYCDNSQKGLNCKGYGGVR